LHDIESKIKITTITRTAATIIMIITITAVLIIMMMITTILIMMIIIMIMIIMAPYDWCLFFIKLFHTYTDRHNLFIIVLCSLPWYNL